MPKELTKRLIGAALGVAVGLMILFIGFFQTLLLVILALVGWWLSGKREMPRWLDALISRIHTRHF